MKNVLAILLPILALKIMAHTNTNTSSHTFEYNFDNLYRNDLLEDANGIFYLAYNVFKSEKYI